MKIKEITDEIKRLRNITLTQDDDKRKITIERKEK
jgi:hypothetical protein